jgi:IclR family acetate operon transcriptional repressor
MESVRNALAVLEAVAQSPGIGVSELARRLGIPKSTAQRGLETLSGGGWVSRGAGPRDGWLAGPRLFALARVAEPAPGLRRAALPHMRWLRDMTGETIHLMAPDGGEMVLIERLDSTQPLRTVRQLGGRVPLHVASNGKAVLAALPAAEQEGYLAAPLFPSSRLSITDPDRLREVLAEVRACGFAVSRGELDDGINAVAAAILRPDGRPVGSLSISCPAARLTEARIPEYGAMVAEAACRIARDAASAGFSAP